MAIPPAVEKTNSCPIWVPLCAYCWLAKTMHTARAIEGPQVEPKAVFWWSEQ